MSCAEIWDNGYNGGETKGWAIAKEGSQYKYYKSTLGSTEYNTSTDITRKPNTGSLDYWWLLAFLSNKKIDSTTYLYYKRKNVCR